MPGAKPFGSPPPRLPFLRKNKKVFLKTQMIASHLHTTTSTLTKEARKNKPEVHCEQEEVQLFYPFLKESP